MFGVALSCQIFAKSSMTDVSHSLLKGPDVRGGKAQVAQDQMGKGKVSMEEEGEWAHFGCLGGGLADVH